MLETINAEKRLATAISALSWRWVALLCLAGSLSVTNPAEPSSAAAQAEHAFRTNRARFQNERPSVEAAWQFARACFDWAEFSQSDEQRAEIAHEGIAAARRGLGRFPNSAEVHYYLAMNLGQLARTKTVGALKLVREMEREFKTAITLDEKIDHAGPRRSLGLLYRDAPGWPASIGSRSKARPELERAVELFPLFPENRLYLAESFVLWGEKRLLAREIEVLRTALPKARLEMTGAEWRSNWADWDKRWRELQRAVTKLDPPGGRR